MGMHRWLLGGLIGGAAGALIWVVVGYASEYEIGWIAWGIGFLVGAGVRYGAYLGDEDESEAQGFLAAAMAFGAIVTAKFILFLILTNGMDAGGLGDLAGKIRYDDEGMIASIADEILLDMMGEEVEIRLRSGVTFDEASHEADYPEEIWQKAEAQWNQLSPQQQQEQKREQRELALLVAEISNLTSKPSFFDFFSPWDALWFGLAMITAYKIGIGTYGTDD